MGTLSENISKALHKILEPNVIAKKLQALKDFVKMLTSEVCISHNMQNYTLWLLQAMTCYKTKEGKSQLLLDFILDLATFTLKNETSFSTLRSEKFLVDLTKTFQITGEPIQKRHIQYIKLVDASVNHKQGLDWIMNSSAWVDVVVLARQEQSVIAQEGYYTIARLLEATSISHQTLCVKIIELITFPLTNKVVNYQAQCKTLQPDIKCLVDVLEKLIENFSNKALDVFVEKKIAHLCDSLSAQSKNRNLRMQLYRIVIMLSFYQLTQTLEGIKMVKQNLAEVIGLRKLLLQEFEDGNHFGIVKTCCYALKYYTKMEDKLPKYFCNGKILDLKHEFLFYHCCFVASTPWKMVGFSEVIKNYYDDLPRMEFWTHISNLSSRESIMLLYKIRDLCFGAPLFDAEMLALKSIVDTKAFYCQSVIRIVFRMLLYILEDILLYGKKTITSPFYSIEKEQEFVSSLMEAMSDFIETFELCYGHCLGLSDIIELVMSWLNSSQSRQLAVSGLRLLNISIIRNMSSNLVLLRDPNDPSLANLVSLLYIKCTDECWEVRRASLEVSYSITTKSCHDLLTIKNALTSEHFTKMILQIAFDEKNCLVRAMAFHLIGSIIKFKATDVFTTDEFVDMVVNTLNTSHNNTLREETVNLLAEIYQRCGPTDQKTHRIYRCILAIAQPYGCEKLWQSILRFWENVVNKHLSNEGLEDGKFPAALFSKEKKKIIVLTNDEIRRRLVKTFNNLSRTGCLAQICQTLEDENAPDEIYKLARKIATNLSNLMKIYEVTGKEIESSENLSAYNEESAVTVDATDHIINYLFFDMSFHGKSNSPEVKLVDLIEDHLSPQGFLNIVQSKQDLTKEFKSLKKFQDLIIRIVEPNC